LVLGGVSGLVWVLEDHERDALAAVSLDKFRDKVIAHARRKAVFSPALSDPDYQRIADHIFDRVHGFLGAYPNASYDSYVRMMLVYFTHGIAQVEGPHMQESLRNDRIGINTRAMISYELVREMMRRGL